MISIFQGNGTIFFADSIESILVFFLIKRVKITYEDHICIRKQSVLHSGPQKLHINLAMVITAPLSQIFLPEYLHLHIVMSLLLISGDHIQTHPFVLRMVNDTFLLTYRYLCNPKS